MEARELADFAEALAEAEKLIANSAAVVQRAKAKCHEDFYEHVDVISKRLSELRVHSEWLRLVALGIIDPSASPELKGRQGADRRVAIDRRVAGMRQQLLAHSAKLKKSA
ncbi:MAG: hypothetical protein ABI423_07700 [Burkholderiales bacterium]